MEKKKQPVKRMVLSKETLRVMENRQLKGVDGAISGSICGWDTCYQICRGTATC